MRTSATLLQQVRQALFAVFILGGFAGLLALAMPLLARYALDCVIPLGDPEALGLAALAAGAAGLALLCIEAARERIVLQARLWLDHTLGQHILDRGANVGAPLPELHQQAGALAQLGDGLIAQVVLPALDALWAPIGIVALALLHPLLGGLAAVAVLGLILTAGAQSKPIARLEQRDRRAAEPIARWWQSATATGDAVPLAATAGAEWEQLNRHRVAAAYALGKRIGLLRGVARFVRTVSRLGVIALAAWLVMRHELSVGACVAAILVQARMLAPIESLVASLATLRDTAAAYGRLRALSEEDAVCCGVLHFERIGRAAPVLPTAPPRLDVRGPLALASFAIVTCLAAGLGVVATGAPAPLLPLAIQTGSILDAAAVTSVRHAKGGIVARVYVTEGASVKAGDILISLDTAALDSEIAVLRSQAAAAQRMLIAVSGEAAAVAASAPADRAKVSDLERRVAALETQANDLLDRVAAAERDLPMSEIRAPIAGRVVALSVRGPNAAIAPGAIVAQIVAPERWMLVDGFARPILRMVQRAYRSI
jgi:Biotin-lipoyl like